jgi:hypothetical protein
VAALFQRSANGYLRTTLGFAALVLVGCPCALWIYVRTPYVTGETYGADQPVNFDHRHHTRDEGIDCLYCHYTAERSPYAGIPPTSTCMGCHNQIWNDDIQIEPLRRSYWSNEAIAWNRVHDLPDFVYFDHSIHVNNGVGCVTCHGRVDEMPRVFQAKPLTMGWCLECHRDPNPFLRPLDEITNMEWDPQGDQWLIGADLAQEFDVERPTHCTVCHR